MQTDLCWNKTKRKKTIFYSYDVCHQACNRQRARDRVVFGWWIDKTKQNTTMFHETIFHQCKQNQTCHRTLIHGRYWHIQGLISRYRECIIFDQRRKGISWTFNSFACVPLFLVSWTMHQLAINNNPLGRQSFSLLHSAQMTLTQLGATHLHQWKDGKESRNITSDAVSFGHPLSGIFCLETTCTAGWFYTQIIYKQKRAVANPLTGHWPKCINS